MTEFNNRSDKDILQDIEKSLLEDETFSSENVHAEVKNGKVVLAGSVSSPEINHQVQDVVENIPGVTMVVNDLNIEITNKE